MRSKVIFFSLIGFVFFSPYICLSEVKTVQGEYCNIFLGDMKNIEEGREELRTLSISTITPVNLIHDG